MIIYFCGVIRNFFSVKSKFKKSKMNFSDAEQLQCVVILKYSLRLRLIILTVIFILTPFRYLNALAEIYFHSYRIRVNTVYTWCTIKVTYVDKISVRVSINRPKIPD